jgi:peptide alpha-N-acetyltransferase
VAALFARDGDQASNLYDMQCAWFENEAGRCHARAGNRARALKYFAAVIQHYEDTEEDQFDFHSYCMRKSTLRSYVEMLRATDAVYDKPRFREAARGLIRAYVSVHDDPPADAAAAEEALLAALSKEERQKARKKQKAAKERAEKEAAERAEKEAAERAAAAEAAAKEGKKPPAKSEKPPDPDPLGEKLLATKTPLEDALKALALLEKARLTPRGDARPRVFRVRQAEQAAFSVARFEARRRRGQRRFRDASQRRFFGVEDVRRRPRGPPRAGGGEGRRGAHRRTDARWFFD